MSQREREMEQLDAIESFPENLIVRHRAEEVQNESRRRNQSISQSATEPRSTSTAPVKENWGWSGESPMIQKIHYLFTKETFLMAIKIFRFGAFIKCVPFELEHKNGSAGSLRVRPFSKKWQWALWHIVNWIMFGMLAFEFISFYFLWQRMSFGKEIAFHILYLLYVSWIFVYFLPLYYNPRACIVLLNHHDEIMRNSSRLGLDGKHWASHPFVILSVYYLAWIMIFFDLVLVAFYLRYPERSQYIYSAFPSAWKEDDKVLYGLCALFELFWFGCGSALIILYFCFWLESIYTFNGSLNQLRAKQYMNETVIEAYLYLQCFCISFNDFNGGLFATGFSFVLGATPALLIYLSLTTYHMLSIFVYLGFPAFTLILMSLIVLFLPQHSKVQIKSTDVLDHFTHLPIGTRPQSQSQSRIHSSDLVNLSHLSEAERRGYLRRRAKAFRRLRIQISFFGAFSLDTSAIMMDQIINNVLLLLSF